MSQRRRRRLSAVPIIAVIALLLVGTVATTLAIPAAAPSPAPEESLLPFVAPTAPPTATPFGRYPASAETGLISACVSGIDPNTVPGPIAQAFCVCTVNKYEQLYPTYEDFQRATSSGAVTDKTKTDVANQCARQIVGG